MSATLKAFGRVVSPLSTTFTHSKTNELLRFSKQHGTVFSVTYSNPAARIVFAPFNVVAIITSSSLSLNWIG
jgi:hypothetical protein